jgi:hypothetical protein
MSVGGGSAYPSREFVGGHVDTVHHTGMTLRDYFAAKAMAACISADPSNMNHTTAPAKAAEWAYEFADAMLEERAK